MTDELNPSQAGADLAASAAECDRLRNLPCASCMDLKTRAEEFEQKFLAEERRANLFETAARTVYERLPADGRAVIDNAIREAARQA